MALGRKLRTLRDELGMSQAQLSAQAELSQGYLSQLENEEVRNPSAAMIFRLAQALNVDPRVLMQAAGYPQAAAGANGDSEFEVAVDPELLRFLARLSQEQQSHLLRMLEGIEGCGTSGRARSRAPQRR